MRAVIKLIVVIFIFLFITVYLIKVTAQTPSCTLKPNGDADCNGVIDIVDFEIWRKEFTGTLTTKTADFSSDNIVNIVDFEIWRKNSFGTFDTLTPTATPVVTVTIPPTVTRTPTPSSPTATPTPGTRLTPAPAKKGIWISQDEILKLPITGETGCNTNCSEAWGRLTSDAKNSVNKPDFTNQDSMNDVYTLAKAIVSVRTNNTTYKTQVRDALKSLVSTHPISDSKKWDWLGILRGLGSYVIAADIIDLKTFDATFDQNTFRPWLTKVRSAIVEGGRGSVISAQEDRPNNFGTHASASRVAADLYLNDTADLSRAIQVFKGYLGDRSSYSSFTYGTDLSWQCNESAPVGINPVGCVKKGHNIDGVIPDDMRRVVDVDSSCGNMAWPPCKNSNSNYVWEGLQGSVAASEMLFRAGYDSYSWQSKAVLRAVTWLNTTKYDDGKTFPAEGDDSWIIYIINKRYGTNFSHGTITGPGKMVGYADWTHQ